MEDFDPADVCELEEFIAFEEKYAEELNELNSFVDEEIDFNVALKPKLKTTTTLSKSENVKEKEELLKSKAGHKDKENVENFSLTNSKRSFTEVNEFSSKEEKKSLNYLKPKKLKLDESDEFDWSIEDAGINKIKKIKEDKEDLLFKEIIGNNRIRPSRNDDSNENYNKSRRRVFARPMFGSSDLFNVTNTEGERVFLKLCAEEDIPTVEEKRWLSNSSSSGLNLLPVSFDRLKNEVNQKMYIQRMDLENDEGHQNPVKQSSVETKDTDLWVEKYMPKRYTDLLSDDGTNRYVLKWLKLWDHVVFGTEPVKNKWTNEEKDLKTGNILKKDGKPNFEKKKFYDPEDDLTMDVKGRPKKKIALLCGNPGLGKTTLAHVISQHAGYKVVEMNASDDRSPELFRNKIETATQMKSVIGNSKRPNCLIIDEIDGAPIQAINILLDLVKMTDPNVLGKIPKSKKKKKKKEFFLNRPIICICNDQFVPALRQLRQVAFTLKFPPTLSTRLAGRLLSISQNENLRIDMGALLFLADKAENDIRSCLNTLQFIQQRKKHVKPDDLKKLEIGQKDMKKGTNIILTEVFQLQKSNKMKYSENLKNDIVSDNKSSILTSRFHYILHLVSGNSEHEKLMQGLHDQYLHSKTKDPYLESLNLGTDWLIFTDILQKKVAGNQDYVLWRYLSFLPVAFHLFFAKASFSKLQYSNANYENHLKLTHNKQTLTMMVNGMSPHQRRNCTNAVMTSDIIPYLYFITLPNLRPVNTKLYSESEKQIFASLVRTLISYNLTYRQERNLEGQYTYVLEPNIEELCSYPGLPQHRQLLYATKQLIGREVEMEKMRIAERIVKKGDEIITSSSKSNNAINVTQKQQLEPKKIHKFVDSPQLDFFGRAVTPVAKSTVVKSKQKGDENKATLVINTKTRFQFNEGYTNAVRRTVKTHEFF